MLKPESASWDTVIQGYRAEIHWEVEAETKKQERLHMAMATGVLWVKLDRDNSTQSRTIDDWPVAWSVWKTWSSMQSKKKSQKK